MEKSRIQSCQLQFWLKQCYESLPERGPAELMELGFTFNYDIKYRMGREG